MFRDAVRIHSPIPAIGWGLLLLSTLSPASFAAASDDATMLPSQDPQPRYILAGEILSEESLLPNTNLPALSVALLGLDQTYRSTTEAHRDGSFRFANLAAGNYTVVVVRQGLGEIRRSVHIGEDAADPRNIVETRIPYSSAEAAANPSVGTVSLTSLQIPEAAENLYRDAQRQLSKGNPDAAQRMLLEASRLAPEYAAAWNTLGVIFFQLGDASQAEYFYRQALNAEPGYIHAVLNLGAVLLRFGRYQEALDYNEFAIAELPRDASANVQLGINYFHLGKLAAAEPLLEQAIAIDPKHIAHPHLLLAEIAAGKGEIARSIGLLEQALSLGLEAPLASQTQAKLSQLRTSHSAAADGDE